MKNKKTGRLADVWGRISVSLVGYQVKTAKMEEEIKNYKKILETIFEDGCEDGLGRCFFCYAFFGIGEPHNPDCIYKQIERILGK